MSPRKPLAEKGRFKVGDDGRDVALAIATSEDFTAAMVELDHAFRVEQHVALLRRFPLEAEAVAETRRAVHQATFRSAVTPLVPQCWPP